MFILILSLKDYQRLAVVTIKETRGMKSVPLPKKHKKNVYFCS